MTEQRQVVCRAVTTVYRNSEHRVVVDLHEMGDDLSSVIQLLKELQEEHGHLGKLSLDLDYVPYTDGEDQQYVLMVERPETDEEFTARMTREKKAQEYRTAAEKKRLVELLEKYGDPTK